MSEPLVYLNGDFAPRSSTHLELHDAGFIFGATATDLCRTFRHKLFRLQDHLVRFRTSCQYAHVPLLPTDGELTAIAERLVQHNAGLIRAEEDLALVMFATPGPIGYYAGAEGGAGDAPPTLAMHTFPLPFGRYVSLFREGARLVIVSVRQPPSQTIDPRIKQRSRLHWWLAEQEARSLDPGASALVLDTGDHVTETAAANFLIVRRGVVTSPPRSSILGGISLLVIQELCAELGISFEERPISVADCFGADEAFLTSTPYCTVGVSRINGVSIRWPGVVWQRLLEAWSRQAGLDIRGQVMSAAHRLM